MNNMDKLRTAVQAMRDAQQREKDAVSELNASRKALNDVKQRVLQAMKLMGVSEVFQGGDVINCVQTQGAEVLEINIARRNPPVVL